MLKWATRRETDIIIKIMDRIQKAGNEIDRSTVAMDLEAAHANGCRLRLADMVKGALRDIMHDVHGIAKNIDRKTGALKEGWKPRFAA